MFVYNEMNLESLVSDVKSHFLAIEGCAGLVGYDLVCYQASICCDPLGQTFDFLICLIAGILESALRGNSSIVASVLIAGILESALRGQEFNVFDLFDSRYSGICPPGAKV